MFLSLLIRSFALSPNHSCWSTIIIVIWKLNCWNLLSLRCCSFFFGGKVPCNAMRRKIQSIAFRMEQKKVPNQEKKNRKLSFFCLVELQRFSNHSAEKILQRFYRKFLKKTWNDNEFLKKLSRIGNLKIWMHWFLFSIHVQLKSPSKIKNFHVRLVSQKSCQQKLYHDPFAKVQKWK